MKRLLLEYAVPALVVSAAFAGGVITGQLTQSTRDAKDLDACLAVGNDLGDKAVEYRAVAERAAEGFEECLKLLTSHTLKKGDDGGVEQL